MMDKWCILAYYIGRDLLYVLMSLFKNRRICYTNLMELNVPGNNVICKNELQLESEDVCLLMNKLNNLLFDLELNAIKMNDSMNKVENEDEFLISEDESDSSSCDDHLMNLVECMRQNRMCNIGRLEKRHNSINECKVFSCSKGHRYLMNRKFDPSIAKAIQIHRGDCDSEYKCYFPLCSLCQDEHDNSNLKGNFRKSMYKYLPDLENIMRVANVGYKKSDSSTNLIKHCNDLLVSKRVLGHSVSKSLPDVLDFLLQVEHKNIITYLWYSFNPRILYMFSYYQWHSMKSHHFLIANVSTIITQIAKTVTFLHDNEIIYLNWSSDNFLINDDGSEVKLCNFSNAVLLNKCSQDIEHLCDLERIFYPLLIPPEVSKKRSIGYHSDVYGLACLFYELITGHVIHIDLAHCMPDEIREALENGHAITTQCVHNQSLLKFLMSCFQKDYCSRPSVLKFYDLDFYERNIFCCFHFQ